MHGILKPEGMSKEKGRATIAESQLSSIKFVETDIQIDLYAGTSPFILIKNDVFSIK